jgi:ABC-type transport system involved in multi-copper enzyme maturation permease subunit
MRYYATLFLYTSRRFLRLEGYTALAVIVFYFATLSMSQTPRGGRSILSAYYSIFTVGMILLAMNLLPRESDEHTLEILWSQPFHRGALVLVQVASLTVWCGVVMGLILVLFARFLTAETFPLWVGIFGLTTAFAVALITVLISTFCRNAIATGIVAALIFGVHYFWLKELGPINLYFNPLPEPITRAFVPSGADKVPIFSALMNRFFLLVLLGFVYDYLLLRLRHSSAWLT